MIVVRKTTKKHSRNLQTAKLRFSYVLKSWSHKTLPRPFSSWVYTIRYQSTPLRLSPTKMPNQQRDSTWVQVPSDLLLHPDFQAMLWQERDIQSAAIAGEGDVTFFWAPQCLESFDWNLSRSLVGERCLWSFLIGSPFRAWWRATLNYRWHVYLSCHWNNETQLPQGEKTLQTAQIRLAPRNSGARICTKATVLASGFSASRCS